MIIFRKGDKKSYQGALFFSIHMCLFFNYIKILDDERYVYGNNNTDNNGL